jgi:hypothetical protein
MKQNSFVKLGYKGLPALTSASPRASRLRLL